MKKYITYIIILAIGLLLGWLIFKSTTSTETVHNHDQVSDTGSMWTCSMHPQILQSEPGDCPICGMDLIPIESSSEGLSVNQFKLSENAMALANIQTTIVGKNRTEANATTLSGKIVENEEANQVQVSYVSGRIEQLNINYTGEKISKGQILATVYSPELYAAQQELITAANLKISQPALYQAVRNKLKIWKLSENQINKIETSGKVTENMPVFATVTGTVSEKLVQQGDYVNQGQPLLKVANLNSVWANFDVYENQISLFNKGQKVKITTKVQPNLYFEGVVDFIDPVLNTNTRTVNLRVVLNNEKELFKPGMFVQASVETQKENIEEVLTIPSSAVLWTGKQSVVYVKTVPNQPVFEMREVTLGNLNGDFYQVLEGLNNGDIIVTNGTFTVDAAAQLQGKKSMMNKSGGKSATGHEHHSGGASSVQIDNNNHQIAPKNEVSVAFQIQLNHVYGDYIKLKDALIQNNNALVVLEAKKLLTNLDQINDKLLTDEKPHHLWMSIREAIKSSAQSITKTNNIIEQRADFKLLSNEFIKAVTQFGVNQTVYHQYCPMVENNTGGDWLSNEAQVLNPYYGDAMLKCGEVVEIIKH